MNRYTLVVLLCLVCCATGALAQLNVTGVVTNTSCFGGTNGAINLNVTGAGGGPSVGTYCTPMYTNLPCGCPTTWDHINNFSTTGGITNITNLNSGCSNPGGTQYTVSYVFFPTMIVTVNPGSSFNFAVQCGNSSTGCTNQFAQGFRIWIDYNNDGDMSDPGEDVWNSGTSGFQMFTGTITVPAGTTCGAKRMRVKCTYAGVPSSNGACETSSFGETEEYTVQVCTPASFQWSNGATTEDINNLPAGNYTVTVTAGAQSTVLTYTVNQPSQVITNVTAANNDTLLCPGEQTTLTASGASTWTYTWSNGATGNTLTATQPGVYTVTATNSNGCSATDQITVLTATATNPPVITPSDTTVLCQGGSVTLTAAPATGIQWHPNGETTASITVSQSGSFYVTFTDASGCTGTSETAVVTVIAPPSPSIAASGPTSFCQGGSVTLTSNYTFGNSWSNGATTQSITASTSGTYGLTVSAGGCSGTATAVTVTVTPLPSAQITPSGATAFCQGGSVMLSSNAASGNAWSNGSASQQISVTASGSFSLTVTDAAGCTATAGPVNVTVNPPPAPPVISASGPTAVCEGNTVVLTSSYAAGNQWSSGQSGGSITVSTAGNYAVTVTDANGCTAASAVTQITVNPVPTSTFNVPATVCVIDEVTASFTGTASAGAEFNWDFNDALYNGSGAGPYAITFPNTGNYTISLQVTEPATGCISSITSQTVTVNTNPSADFTVSESALCKGATAYVDYTGTAPANATYNWDFGSATIMTGSGQGPYMLQFDDDGLVTVSLTVTQGSCSSDPVSASVTVHPLPTAAFSVLHGTGCDSVTSQFSALQPNATYAWSLGDGSEATTQTVSHFYLPGVYDVSLAVVDENGCTAMYDDSATVRVYATPVAKFTSAPELVDTLDMDEAEITFTNQSTHATSYNWDFGDGNTAYEASPQHAYLESGAYTVVLTATNHLGCTDTAKSELFFVLPGGVTFIPNAFSPNGDGMNDVFHVYSFRYKEAYVTVYDRIGQRVFETKDLSMGWDGRMRGKACNPGVYVYYCRIHYMTGEIKEYFGDVTLMH